MSRSHSLLLIPVMCAAGLVARAQAPSIRSIHLVPRLTIESAVGITNQIQYTNRLSGVDWITLTNVLVTQSPYRFVDADAPQDVARFYRVVGLGTTNPSSPAGMVLIPAGPFVMGDCMIPSDGRPNELPLHTVHVSAFHMDQTEVTLSLWDSVYTWALTNNYTFESGAQGKASNHPVHSVSWFQAVKWCNARSEMERRVPAYYTDVACTTVYRSSSSALYVRWDQGYRLPTEAEWEKAARGGLGGHRFPWSDEETISFARANYDAETPYPYDLSTRPWPAFHPDYYDGVEPYTSPVGSFPANGYGLFDMAGNVWEMCWDYWSETYYASSPINDPTGPPSSTARVMRGGSWLDGAASARAASRATSTGGFRSIGFRTVLSQP